MQIQRFEMPFIKSNMYVISEGAHLLVIDPVWSEKALVDVRQSGAEDALVLLTHEHFDHTCGLNSLRELLPCHVIATRLCAERIAVAKNNRSGALMGLADRYDREELMEFHRAIGNYTCWVDETFEQSHALVWQGHRLELRATPGHMPGSCCVELDGEYVFTGDSLIPGEPVITRFPGGSMEEYEAVTLPYLRSLDEKMQVMPGHGIPCPMKKFLQEDTRFTELS